MKSISVPKKRLLQICWMLGCGGIKLNMKDSSIIGRNLKVIPFAPFYQILYGPLEKEALMNQFQQGLRNDVKDLLRTFHEDSKSSIEAINH